MRHTRFSAGINPNPLAKFPPCLDILFAPTETASADLGNVLTATDELATFRLAPEFARVRRLSEEAPQFGTIHGVRRKTNFPN